MKKTYNSPDSLVVTYPTTNRPGDGVWGRRTAKYLTGEPCILLEAMVVCGNTWVVLIYI
jgi:hypothetical protein